MNPTNGLFLWILIGTLAGWFASNATRTGAKQEPYVYVDVVSGLAGALLAGYFTQALFANHAWNRGFFASLGAAMLGACVLIGITKLLFPLISHSTGKQDGRILDR